MPSYNAIAFLIDLALSVSIVLLIYKSIGQRLRDLLDNVVRLPEGTAFYMRAFVLVLVCVVFSRVLTGIDLKPEARFMEYVWAVGRDVSGLFDNLFAMLLVLVGVVTLLVVVLKPKHDK